MTDKLNEIKKDLDSILPKLKQLSQTIEEYLPSSGFGEDDEERFLVKEYRYLGSLMNDIVTHEEYLACDVVAEGYLRLNKNGRYECSGIELNSGTIVELYIYSIEVDTNLSEIELLDVCQAIENQLGRKRIIRFGPRTIDLDLLIYQKQWIQTDRLILTHPRMHERGFVLIPLVEIAPNLLPPNGNRPVKYSLKNYQIMNGRM